FDEVGYYAVSGMDKMLAMGRGLGFMFYLGFQELPGLKARIGESMYSLLGNANLQILMKLQEGSETRQYVERTAGESEVTQQTSYTATDSGGYRDAQHAEVRRVARVDWKDLRGLIEGEAIVLFGNRRIYAKLFYAKVNPRGRLRLNRPAVLRAPAVEAIERNTARAATIRKLIESGGARSPDAVATGPVLAAMMEGFRKEMALNEKTIAECVQAAIMAAGNDNPAPAAPASVARAEPARAPVSAAAPAHPAPVTAYDSMAESAYDRPIEAHVDVPILPTKAADREVLALLSLIEEYAGRPRAEARVAAMQVLAERDAAMADVPHDAPTMPDDRLAQLVEATIANLTITGPVAQAAE
ncbi:MAG: TraM recognition domain-containing protein, partial [Janthinobacterium lividum]